MTKDVKCWDNYWGEDNSNRLTKQRIEVFRRLIGALPIGSILEIGCSNGYNLAAISKLGEYKLTGIDIASRAIKATDKSIANFMVMDAFDISFPDMSFDLVLCCSFFCIFFNSHLPKLIKGITRVCRKYILVIDYHGQPEPPDPSTWQKRDYDGLFPGFKVIKFEPIVKEISSNMSAWLFSRGMED